jgi:hypothetical protein
MNNKSFESFLADFPKMESELLRAEKSDDSKFILRVIRRAENFRLNIQKYLNNNSSAKDMTECITAERLTVLTMRASDKRTPIII